MSSAGFDAMMDGVEDRLEAALAEAAFKAMTHIHVMTTPKVPVETGNLAGSGSVTNTGPASARIYYPGPYARRQEYELDYRHEHGQALYLTTTVVQEADNALDIAAKVIRDAIG